LLDFIFNLVKKNHFIYSILTFLVDDFDKLSKKNNSTSKISSIFKGNLINRVTKYMNLLNYLVSSKKLSKIFKKNSKNGK
jgi:uncharacterized protein YfbU (UPF0304 family)